MSKLNPNNNVTPVSHIIVSGAKENNLKNISLNIPKKKLVVLTGVSGSGKSSLAFDTIYAESQRRYLDSLSSYVRQFLGNSKKPDVDAIEGLSPSISIDQKTTSHNPRSTVGTVTEIYDYLRLLYARIGIPTCPKGHGPIKTVTIKNIVDQVMELPDQTKIQILAPIVRNEKGTLKIHLEKLKKNGFLRVMLDGVSYNLDQELEVNKNQRHNLAIIVDRIVLRHDKTTYSRLYAGIELACEESHGLVSLQVQNNDQVVKIINFSKHYACMKCGFSIPELEPRLFSFNSPIGACRGCNGLGFSYEPDRNKIFLHPDRSIIDGGIDYFKNTVNTSSFDWQKFEHLLKHYDISLFKPINAMTPQEINWLFYGSDDSIQIRIRSASGKKYESFEPIEGIGTLIKRRHQETQSEGARDFYTKYMSETRCDLCCGQKLSSVALSVLLGGKNIIQVTELSIQDAVNFFFNLTLTDQQQKIGKLVLKEIIDRLNFLLDVGLSYLNLSRNAASLSGGELQRIRLASQIGSALTGVLYVLDEPSIGLHQRDNHKLINTIKKMRDLGNTILVVEHDDETMLAAD